MNKAAFDHLLSTLKDPMIATVQDFIKIPSLKAAPAPNAPFGPELRKMLSLAMQTCSDLGFVVRDFDGYAMDAAMGEGPDEDALAILAHLDIVPVGDGWTVDPFGGEIKDGILYGRGASDDKGPLVAALYAMLAVKMSGIPLKRQVKLIIGCDEESGMTDIPYYKSKTVIPRSGFSPDATYPIINTEKGMVGLHLKAPLPKNGLKVLELHVGERQNVIPGSASALVEGGEDLVQQVAAISKKHGWPVQAKVENGACRITATGINGHAAYPELARNALGQLLITLRDLGATGAVAELADKLGIQYYGENLGIQSQDKTSGPLTVNLGILHLKDGELTGTLDIRYPLLVNGKRILDTVKAHLSGIEVTQRFFKEPHHVPASSPLVQGLLAAYHEVTGLPKETLSTGGGTYARMLEEGVAFGASFPGDPDVAHQADEHVKVDNLVKNMKIVAYAILRLAGAEGALDD